MRELLSKMSDKVAGMFINKSLQDQSAKDILGQRRDLFFIASWCRKMVLLPSFL